MDKKFYGYTNQPTLIETSPFDIYNCIAVGYIIIKEYIDNVVKTEEYKKNSLACVPQELIGANLLGVFCKFIGRLIDLKQLNLQKPNIETLEDFLNGIKSFERKVTSPRLMPMLFYNKREITILLNTFNEFSSDIHKIIPTYKGFRYENPYIFSFFKECLSF